MSKMKHQILPQQKEQDNEIIRVVKQVKLIFSDSKIKQGEFLNQCIEIFELTLEILEPQNSIQLFMAQNGEIMNLLIKTFQSLLSDEITFNEKAKVVEFFRKFALIEGGAQLLLGFEILQKLVSQNFLNNLIKEPFYFMQEEPIRNPNHVIWCQILLFIRIMNFHLISEARYRSSLSAQLKIYI